MPVTPTYPGVYIEEIPSGVRTITGVATSIAAFIGYFKRGPVNQATQLFNIGDFEREFGGLDTLSEAGYAIQQFFLNGGTEAWVVRTASEDADNPLSEASVEILNRPGGTQALVVEAVNPGRWGHYVRLFVDYDTFEPETLFNLTVSEFSPENLNGPPLRTETFRNLSMNPDDPNFVGAIVNDDNSGSNIVQIVEVTGTERPAQNGTVSGNLSPFPTITASEPQVNVTIGSTTATAQFRSPPTTIAQARSGLESAIRASRPADPAFAQTVVQVLGNQLRVLAGPMTPPAPIAFAPGGTDPTLSELRLGDDVATPIEAIVSETPMLPLTAGEISVATSDDQSVTVTLGEAGDPPINDVAEARELLELQLRSIANDADTPIDIAEALTNVRVAVLENRLAMIPESLGVTLTFAPTDGDTDTVANWGLGTTQRFEGTLSGDLPEPPVVSSPNPTLILQIGSSAPTTVSLSLPDSLTLDAIATVLENAIQSLGDVDPGFAATRVVPYSFNDENRLVVLTETGTNTVVFTASPADSTTVNELQLADAIANVPDYRLGEGLIPGSAQGGGESGSPGLPPDGAALIGDQNNKEGIFALEDVDLFNILCIPRTAIVSGSNALAPDRNEAMAAAGAVLTQAVSYCQNRRAMLIVDPPNDVDDLQEVQTFFDGLPRSRNAALYFPRVMIPDPLNNFRLRAFGPSGTLAGVWARTDANRGVWKAPAGTEATLTNVPKLDVVLSDAQNGVLNPLGINALRSFPIFGRVSWGARTRQGADRLADEYKYIPVRRLALFIEESLFRGLQWVVFEPNDEPLWAQIRLNVGAFMQNLFRQGAFQGTSPREAYLVKVDRETTTQNDINQGIVNVLVGFAPLRPAEFVFIRIQQLAGQLQT